MVLIIEIGYALKIIPFIGCFWLRNWPLKIHLPVIKYMLILRPPPPIWVMLKQQRLLTFTLSLAERLEKVAEGPLSKLGRNWQQRRSGGEDSAPLPAILGRTRERGAVRHQVGHVRSFPAEKVDSVLGSFWSQDGCVHCNFRSIAAWSVVLYCMYIIIYYCCFLYRLSLPRIPLHLVFWLSYWSGSSFNTYLYPQTQRFDSMSQLSPKPSKNHHELSVSMFRSFKKCYNTSVIKFSSF